MKSIPLARLALSVLMAGLFARAASAQLDISAFGTNYTQDFNDIGNGLPTGWAVYSNAATSSLGIVAAFNLAKTTWSTSGFNNYASTVGNTGANFLGSESSTIQGNCTNRALGAGLVAATDPGASFVLVLSNTVGAVDFKLSFDFLMLRVQPRTNIWLLQYGLGTSPPNFATVAIFGDPAVFSATHTNISFENALDNRSENVVIRLVTLVDSTGSGSRDTVGVDNFSLSWTAGTSSVTNPPGIINQSGSTIAMVGTASSLSVAPSGTPPLYYQWYKDNIPLVDGGNISGANTNLLSFTNVVHTNTGNYYLHITNAAGFTNSVTVSLVVTGFVIQHIANTNTLSGVPVAGIPLTFIDPVPGISSATGSSDNQSLLPDAGVTVTGSNTNRAVTISPVAGKSGVAVATITASDGSFSTNASFALLVVPNTNVVFNDYFDYGDGALDAKSAFLWRNHSGNAGETQVTNHQLIISQSLGEDVNVSLTRPFLTNTAAAIYSKFTVRFTDLPNAAGTYFAHFKDDSTTRFRGLIWASTTGAAAGKLRLSISNGTTNSAANTTPFPQDLDTNVTYTIVTKFDLDSATSTLWLNPTNETDPSVVAGDASTPLNISTYAFRQQSGEGRLLVDDLVVGNSFAAVTAVVSPAPVLQAQRFGAGVVLSWADASYSLQSASVVTGAYSPVITASPYTNPISGSQKYFRLSKP